MSTPWGASSQWSRQSLLAAFHNDVQGGDRMFQFAERMAQDPQREPRLIELLYQCLSLASRGVPRSIRRASRCCTGAAPPLPAPSPTSAGRIRPISRRNGAG